MFKYIDLRLGFKNKKSPSKLTEGHCDQDEIRTHTSFRSLPPQSSVSTNSTT